MDKRLFGKINRLSIPNMIQKSALAKLTLRFFVSKAAQKLLPISNRGEFLRAKKLRWQRRQNRFLNHVWYNAGLLTLMLGLIPSSGFAAYYVKDQNHSFGLMAPSEEEIEAFETKHPKITEVKPNKIGVARMKMHAVHQNLPLPNIEPVETQSEFVTILGKEKDSEDSKKAATSATILPSFVDNSRLPFFPPIGDQGNLGSCVAFATTYYNATHEIGLLNGINNKFSLRNVYSPKWTYNMINKGENKGAKFTEGYALLAQHGAPSIARFPYDQNYLTWDLSAQDWLDALFARTTPPQYIEGLGGREEQDLTLIKQMLANGHVVSVGTYAGDWVYTMIPTNPTVGADNTYAGQKAISWVNGTYGPHQITIVGYNDNIWVDINGNGQVDPGETGAFLIANSWGTEWGNKGFIWVSYDAFRAKSKVAYGPGQGRVPFGEVFNNKAVAILPKAPLYSPKVVMQFTLKTSERNQISVAGGVSDQVRTSPYKYVTSVALMNSAGAYEFDGTQGDTPMQSTFALDLTDIATPTKPERYYLKISDSGKGIPTNLSSFCVLDFVHGIAIHPVGQYPQYIDRGTILPYIDGPVRPLISRGNVPSADGVSLAEDVVLEEPVITNLLNHKPLNQKNKGSPKIAITAPRFGDAIVGEFAIVIAPQGDIELEKVEFYIDSELVATEMEAPYLTMLDSLHYKNGIHNVHVVGYDKYHVKHKKHITINVQNK